MAAPPSFKLRSRGTSAGAKSLSSRISACKSLRVWAVSMTVIWLLYVCGVVYTAVHVHKNDHQAAASSADDGSNTRRTQEEKKVKHFSPHAVVRISEAQAKDAKNGQAQTQTQTHSQPKKADQKESTKKATNGSKSDKESSKRRIVIRPNYVSQPFGHMVDPDQFLPEEGKSQNNIKIQDSNKVIPPDRVLSAYVERVDQESWKIKPLPDRQKSTASSDQLKKIRYPRLNSCTNLPEQFPVDDYPEGDAFLPWIHDVFPTHDGKFIQFVAQNKRRCKTGSTPEDEAALVEQQPQVALFQHVAVKRVDGTDGEKGKRYRLSSHEDADEDGMATRFICRFKPSMQETLSVFNNDYEWVAARKRYKHLFTEEGRDNGGIATSQLLFQCPVPEELQEMIRTGSSVHDDYATQFVDLIPIRTPPRYGRPEEFLVPSYWNSLGENDRKNVDRYDTSVEWGEDHVLPRIEDSGRWENIPICKPSLMTYEPQALEKVAVKEEEEEPKKAHHLVSCLWASTGYTTRGNRFAINDGQRRMVEWITFNKILGFEHFYLYDNSAAFTNASSLQPIADLFPDDVTIIRWPSKVCNNNPNNVDSVGERSSQYAAESSCRLRFGPHTNWIGQFDIDEYLVPMGEYTSVLPLLDKLDEEDMKIISFASWRAWPRRKYINEPQNIESRELCARRNHKCFDLTIPMNTTFLQAYNCDRQKPGQKKSSMPAEKQIYRPDYVRQHFIHYSTITEATMMDPETFRQKMGNKRVSPDPKSRFGNEVTEGLMLHSKAIARQDTAGWLDNCKKGRPRIDQCRIGFPWPENGDDTVDHDPEGWLYNCYVNPKIDTFWVPKLEDQLFKLHPFASAKKQR